MEDVKHLSFGKRVINYHLGLKPNWKIAKGFDLIYPFESDEARRVFECFFDKYFNDNNSRTFIFGINPGRFGAGVTGVPFTDPFYLEEQCKIKNNFPKRKELSAIFIYDIINDFGGPQKFYKDFYITSICPLGFLKNGKNANYYDDKALQKSLMNKIINSIKTQKSFGCNEKVAYSLGKGKNFKFFNELNKEHHFFEKIIPLAHPRWVMQYKLKEKEMHQKQIVNSLKEALNK